MLAVLADGSTIYPSARLEPTPRYDTGAFFASGQDPVRKDVLEMLLPAVRPRRPATDSGGRVRHAAAGTGGDPPRRRPGRPGHRVDRRRRQRLVGRAGPPNAAWPPTTTCSIRASRRRCSACCGNWPSATPNIRPSPAWRCGCRPTAMPNFPAPTGDWTTRRSPNSSATRTCVVPGNGPQRFAERAACLAQEPQRRAWLEWRAARLAQILSPRLGRTRGDPARQPALSGRRRHDRRAGTGNRAAAGTAAANHHRRRRCCAWASTPANFRINSSASSCCGPNACCPQTSLAARAADLEISQMADVRPLLPSASATPGSLFFHPPREVRIDSFDQQSPFKSEIRRGWFRSRCLRAQQNRRRFVHSLATLDSQVMVDGGWLLPMGQEEAIRDLVAAYRALPADPLPAGRQSPVAATPPSRSLSAAVRTAAKPTSTPSTTRRLAATARLHVEAGPACRIEELTGLRKIAPLMPDSASGMSWEVRLEPYDLVAVQLSEPSVQCSNPQVDVARRRRSRARRRFANSAPGGRAAQSARLGRGRPTPASSVRPRPTGQFPIG